MTNGLLNLNIIKKEDIYRWEGLFNLLKYYILIIPFISSFLKREVF